MGMLDSVDIAGITAGNSAHRRRNEDSALAVLVSSTSVRFIQPEMEDGEAPLAIDSSIVEAVGEGDDSPVRFVALCVADGVGGEPDGDLAANATVEAFGISALGYGFGSQSYGGFVEFTFLEMVNQFRMRFVDRDPASAMIVAGIDYRKNLYLGWVGDCRAYLVRDGRAYVLTRDHSSIRDRLTPTELSSPDVFDQNDNETQVMSRYLGKDAKREWLGTKVFELPCASVETGDVLMVVSDGVYGAFQNRSAQMATRDRFVSLVADLDARSIAKNVIGAAMECGSTDNATIFVARF